MSKSSKEFFFHALKFSMMISFLYGKQWYQIKLLFFDRENRYFLKLITVSLYLKKFFNSLFTYQIFMLLLGLIICNLGTRYPIALRKSTMVKAYASLAYFFFFRPWWLFSDVSIVSTMMWWKHCWTEVV